MRFRNQKPIVRAARVHQGLGALAPQGKVRFNAHQAKEQLEGLGYGVVALGAPGEASDSPGCP